MFINMNKELDTPPVIDSIDIDDLMTEYDEEENNEMNYSKLYLLVLLGTLLIIQFLPINNFLLSSSVKYILSVIILYVFYNKFILDYEL